MMSVPRIYLFQRRVDDRRRLTPEFEQLWRVYTFFLVMLGFLALAFTGELGPIAVVVFVVIWTLGLLRPRLFMRAWPNWMNYVMIWSCLFIIGQLALQFRFSALLYLLLFLALFKCLTLREPLDHLQAMLMAFFMLLACTVITSSVTYLIFMVGFVILVMLDLACYTLAQEAGAVLLTQKSFSPARLFTGAAGEQALFRRLLWGNALFALFVVILAHILFFLMPHYPTDGSYSPFMRQSLPSEPEAVSGFSEDMNLGPVGRIALDERQVMTVNVAWDQDDFRPLPGYLRMRGAIFNLFHEKGWETASLSEPVNDFWSSVTLPLEVSSDGPRLIQSINQNAGAVRRLFAAGYPEQYLTTGTRLLLNYDARALSLNNRGAYGNIFYSVKSVIGDDGKVQFQRMAEAMRRLGIDATPGDSIELATSLSRYDPLLPPADPQLKMPADLREINTSLVDSDLAAKIRRLAVEHGAAPNVPTTAISLFDWLQNDFTYTLIPETPSRMNPLEAFLLHTKKGHCEYFASALVVLLRARDIPARVVTGFYTTERDGNTGKFTVRQSDAHAWTEVWFDGYGWLTVDPTPPTLRGRASFDNFTPPFWKTVSDKIKSFWQNNILDYSNTDTAKSMARFFTRSFEENIRAFGDWAGSYLTGKFGEASDSPSGRFQWNSPQIVLRLRQLTGIAALLILWLVYRSTRNGKSPRDDRDSPVGFMNQLLRKLESLGWKRRPGQTPAELLHHIDQQTQNKWQLSDLLDLYHRNRFANIPPTHEELQKIHRTLREIH